MLTALRDAANNILLIVVVSQCLLFFLSFWQLQLKCVIIVVSVWKQRIHN